MKVIVISMLLFKNLTNSLGFVENSFVSLGCMCNEARIKYKAYENIKAN